MDHVNGSPDNRQPPGQDVAPPPPTMPLRSREAMQSIGAAQLFVAIEAERDDLRKQVEALKAAHQLDADETFEKHRAEIAALQATIGALEARIEVFEGERSLCVSQVLAADARTAAALDEAARWRGLVTVIGSAIERFSFEHARRAEPAERVDAVEGIAKVIETAEVGDGKVSP